MEEIIENYLQSTVLMTFELSLKESEIQINQTCLELNVFNF